MAILLCTLREQNDAITKAGACVARACADWPAMCFDSQVGAILDRSCQDCHSANTRWPWYARVAPFSWILARDVSKGRAKLDFSQWAEKLPSTNQRMEVCDAVSNGSMPLRAYTLVHRNARLSKQDVDSICDWAATPEPTRPGVKALGLDATDETLTSSNNLHSFSKGSR